MLHNPQTNQIIRETTGCGNCRLCLSRCPLTTHQAYSSLSGIEAGCINCGACLSGCPRDALTYQDDTELFLRDLRQGVPIALLAAPAVHQHFPDYRQLFAALKRLGVRSFHSVARHADITLWAYREMLLRYPGHGFITSPCAAVSAYIRRYQPALLPHLLPVYSPLLCTAIYLRQYRGCSLRMAFLSPCIAKRAEIKTCGLPQPVYNVTIDRLRQLLPVAALTEENGYADYDDPGTAQNSLLERYGGVSECLQPHLPDKTFLKVAGFSHAYDFLNSYARDAARNKQLPDLVEIYNCPGGCSQGTGTGAMDPADCGIPPTLQSFIPAAEDAISGKRQADALRLFSGFAATLFLPDFTVSHTESEVSNMNNAITIKDRDTVLDITYRDMLQYHGRFYIAGVAMAYKLLERIMLELPGSAIPSREAFSFTIAVNGPGIIDGLEMATRARSRGHLAVDAGIAANINAPDAADGKGGKYYFEIAYEQQKVAFKLKDNIIPPEFQALAHRSHDGTLDPAGASRLQTLKEEIAVFLTGADASMLFTRLPAAS